MMISVPQTDANAYDRMPEDTTILQVNCIQRAGKVLIAAGSFRVHRHKGASVLSTPEQVARKMSSRKLIVDENPFHFLI